MKIKYARIPTPHFGDTLQDAREAVHEITGGIVHMLSSGVWMTLDEIAADSQQYNEQFPDDGKFETDKLVLAEYMALLVSVGMAVVSFRE